MADRNVILMDILHLTIKKKWFDLIASDKKKIEYREYKPYWVTRLYGKHFDEIHFRNGYGKKSPVMVTECTGMAVIPPDGGYLCAPENGEILNGYQFAIGIGRIKSITS